MRIYRRPNKAIRNSVITIGSYDGIHRGHQVVIQKTIEIARKMASRPKAGLLTFNPIPQQVIYPDFHYILTPLPEKREILTKLGIDFLYLIKFDKQLKSLSPTDFVKSQIVEPLSPCKIVIGYDHRFGKDGMGDVALLKKLAKEFGFEVIVVKEKMAAGEPIKSTRIRERLLLGDVKTANRLLGWNYSISGIVGKGQGIGRLLGFPTCNLKINEIAKLIPVDGVYAVFVWYRGKRYLGVMNIGRRPTFSGDTRTIETLLLDFKQDLYGARLKVELVDRIRPERKFPNAFALSEQIKKDIEQAKRILADFK
uniref:Riboflavin biosynthesis protein n=1 Tax=candidate division WOR-3 bacterium TaxID=2052148 RepID=A0A7C6EAU2_UNCW3